MQKMRPKIQNMQTWAEYAKYARKPLNMQKFHILWKCIFWPALIVCSYKNDIIPSTIYVCVGTFRRSVLTQLKLGPLP